MRARLAFTICILVCIVGLLLTSSWAETGGTDLIVTLKDNQSIDRVHRIHGTRTLKKVPGSPIYLIHSDSPDDGRLIRKLRRDLSVDAVEKNVRLTLQSNTTQPILGQNMDMLLDGRDLTTFFGTYVIKAYANQQALALVRANAVRGISTGAGTRVAYIDTGVDTRHPALRPWLDDGVDLVFNTSVSELSGLSQNMDLLLDQNMDMLLDNRFMFLLNQNMDSLLDNGSGARFPSAFGHGTLVAGLIHLIAPEARIVPIKAFDVYGYTTLFTIVDAVYRAIGLDVDVLNMSFSTTQDSEILGKAIARARAIGIAVVASVGNDGRDARIIYPASFPGVYGVAATDFDDHIANYSNRGKSVSISAPGSAVVSTAPGGRYAAAWGTSFSAPIVSGAMALLASTRAHGQSDSSLVVNTADNIDKLNPGFERTLGKGRLNVYKALMAGR